jgi:hypothetical protein
MPRPGEVALSRSSQMHKAKPTALPLELSQARWTEILVGARDGSEGLDGGGGLVQAMVGFGSRRAGGIRLQLQGAIASAAPAKRLLGHFYLFPKIQELGTCSACWAMDDLFILFVNQNLDQWSLFLLFCVRFNLSLNLFSEISYCFNVVFYCCHL